MAVGGITLAPVFAPWSFVLRGAAGTCHAPLSHHPRCTARRQLLYLPSGLGALQRELAEVPPHVCDVHARTLEALVPSSACDNPFAEVRAFRHRPCDYSSYGGHDGCTGKSFGVLLASSGPQSAWRLLPNGPHHFCSGKEEAAPSSGDLSQTHVLPPPVAVILHYESCVYSRWLDKFTNYAQRVRQGGEQSFLFQFYCESLGVAMGVLDAEERGNSRGIEAAHARATQLYCKWKQEPAELPPTPREGCAIVGKLGITVIPPVTSLLAGVAAGGDAAAAAAMLQSAPTQTLSATASPPAPTSTTPLPTPTPTPRAPTSTTPLPTPTPTPRAPTPPSATPPSGTPPSTAVEPAAAAEISRPSPPVCAEPSPLQPSPLQPHSLPASSTTTTTSSSSTSLHGSLASSREASRGTQRVWVCPHSVSRPCGRSASWRERAQQQRRITA